MRPFAYHDGPRATPCVSDVGGRLLEATCRIFGVDEAELRSSRRVGLSEARWALSYALMMGAGWSSPRVAKLINKDHKAVIYGVKQAVSLRQMDEPFYEAVELLMEAI